MFSGDFIHKQSKKTPPQCHTLLHVLCNLIPISIAIASNGYPLPKYHTLGKGFHENK